MMSCRTGRLRFVTPQTKTCLWDRDSWSLRDVYTFFVLMFIAWEAP